MFKKAFLFSLLIFQTGFTQGFNYQKDFKYLIAQSKDKESPLYYDTLKLNFIENGENFTVENVIALMVGQTNSEDYNAYGDVELERNYQNAQKAPADTIFKYAPGYTKINPISLSVNYGLWKTYEKIKDKKQAEKFRKRFNILCEAVLKTGSGTQDNPYFVISPIDGQVIISLYWKKPILSMGSGVDKYGNFCDILEVMTDKKSEGLFFVVDHAMAMFRKELESSKENPGGNYILDENGKLIERK